ncbi:MAG: N-6 DNA methylase [Thermodesulfovibrionales bacterium]
MPLDVKVGRILDPACGSGGFFISAIEKLYKQI